VWGCSVVTGRTCFDASSGLSHSVPLEEQEMRRLARDTSVVRRTSGTTSRTHWIKWNIYDHQQSNKQSQQMETANSQLRKRERTDSINAHVLFCICVFKHLYSASSGGQPFKLTERKLERTEEESAFQRVEPIKESRLSQSSSATWN